MRRSFPFLAALILAACTGNPIPPIQTTDLAGPTDLATPADLPPPRDFSDQEYIADIDGGRLMGGDCLNRPIAQCTQPDGGMPDRDPAARHLSALLEACGDAMLPVCSTLHVQYDSNGCAVRVEYYGDNHAFPIIRCVIQKLDQTRSGCAMSRTVTVVGFCE